MLCPNCMEIVCECPKPVPRVKNEPPVHEQTYAEQLKIDGPRTPTPVRNGADFLEFDGAGVMLQGVGDGEQHWMLAWMGEAYLVSIHPGHPPQAAKFDASEWAGQAAAVWSAAQKQRELM